MAVEPRDNGLLATTLRTRDEVINTAAALADRPQGKPNKPMTEIARKIIGQLEGPFDLDQFADRYDDALRALVEEKKRGHKITRVAERRDAENAVDLMEALRRSLRSGSTSAKKSATVKKLPDM
jgi:DNA end-binding protein Ku